MVDVRGLILAAVGFPWAPSSAAAAQQLSLSETERHFLPPAPRGPARTRNRGHRDLTEAALYRGVTWRVVCVNMTV